MRREAVQSVRMNRPTLLARAATRLSPPSARRLPLAPRLLRRLVPHSRRPHNGPSLRPIRRPVSSALRRRSVSGIGLQPSIQGSRLPQARLVRPHPLQRHRLRPRRPPQPSPRRLRHRLSRGLPQVPPAQVMRSARPVLRMPNGRIVRIGSVASVRVRTRPPRPRPRRLPRRPPRLLLLQHPRHRRPQRQPPGHSLCRPRPLLRHLPHGRNRRLPARSRLSRRLRP
jgi:hypothetical protein